MKTMYVFECLRARLFFFPKRLLRALGLVISKTLSSGRWH